MMANSATAASRPSRPAKRHRTPARHASHGAAASMRQRNSRCAAAAEAASNTHSCHARPAALSVATMPTPSAFAAEERIAPSSQDLANHLEVRDRELARLVDGLELHLVSGLD